MISVKETRRKYNALLKDVKENDFYKIDLTNRVNCYYCQIYAHVTKTKDIHPGVTPYVFSCEKCESDARSLNYRDVVPHRKPTIEWYRPTLEEVFKLRDKPNLLDHIFNGGLLSREIKK